MRTSSPDELAALDRRRDLAAADLAIDLGGEVHLDAAKLAIGRDQVHRPGW
jgi:hypothetical protein